MFPSACECVSSSAPPAAHIKGKTYVATRDVTRPVSTAHSKMAKAVMSSAYMRCCNTSGDEKLAQNGRGPSGQFSGSARRTIKIASPINSSGQWCAHLNCRDLDSSASNPATSTIKPAQWWLYSLHALSLESFALPALKRDF